MAGAEAAELQTGGKQRKLEHDEQHYEPASGVILMLMVMMGVTMMVMMGVTMMVMMLMRTMMMIMILMIIMVHYEVVDASVSSQVGSSVSNVPQRPTFSRSS